MNEVSSVCGVEEEKEGEEDCDDEEEEEFKKELIEKFNKLLDELEDRDGNEQRKKIDEMNVMIEEMNEKEFYSTFTKKNFDKINKMIEEKKLTLNRAILLMKHIGYWIKLKGLWRYSFENSSLRKRFEKIMIVEEEKKKEEKDEKLFVDVCECYVLINYSTSSELLSICVPYLLKIALKKDESKETQKEVEMALLALNGFRYRIMPEEVYLKEFKDIIQNHQEHHNLTHLAYQSAWGFLICRFLEDEKLNNVIVNELHIIIEATKELEELARNVNWKKEKEEKRRGKEVKEVFIILRWFDIIMDIFHKCKLWNEEFAGLIGSITKLLRSSRDNYGEIYRKCIYSFNDAAENEAVKVDDLLKGEAIDAIMEENFRSTLDDEITSEILKFFQMISSRLKEKGKDKMEEAKRKSTKREIFDNLEEEGYEDIIASFYETIDFRYKEYYEELSLNISDYFVNI
ncbi:uncharacterized protein MONOS_12384 [Monocercomonoides exilis]|uniref:uncharacterized protein n=1 Tax=Monocercomonoides exilis TaxID=2049356 RepID=UPI00355A6AB4|nr:hypothetical protein MONOS_12384 [Monocercomonoides exilis]|eukprot:MONOS_12384.1-p1 / transcript=MONOS_12384.1 / gene=MONOS_12384 / organism=Monocercomonoides_exilis_PA203 / gene_product=unspecified product / transcript_product=unspecified product / location=Mono_scaffold00682:608-2110(+) / protein_length=458 / sequence_SO=supercontig / SO=protein_coding / is_pseudo=false